MNPCVARLTPSPPPPPPHTHTLQASLAAFTVPLQYSSARLSYIAMQPSVLWSDLVVVPVPGEVPGTSTLWVTATTPSGAAST
jgi:hypothetical protein